MILVNMGAWALNLRRSDPLLSANSRLGRALKHPIHVGKVACGNLLQRATTSRSLGSWPEVDELSHQRGLFRVEQPDLHGPGTSHLGAYLPGPILATNSVGYRGTVFGDYLRAAMRRATFEPIEDDGSFFGRIAGFDGVWANADMLQECHDELKEVLDEWLVLRLTEGLPIPAIDGVSLKMLRQAAGCPRTHPQRDAPS